jgi:hypothetical protein
VSPLVTPASLAGQANDRQVCTGGSSCTRRKRILVYIQPGHLAYNAVHSTSAFTATALSTGVLSLLLCAWIHAGPDLHSCWLVVPLVCAAAGGPACSGTCATWGNVAAAVQQGGQVSWRWHLTCLMAVAAGSAQSCTFPVRGLTAASPGSALSVLCGPARHPGTDLCP